ncbi:hypothetical protein MRX96_030660 [Rhipicephalus microplus]
MQALFPVRVSMDQKVGKKDGTLLKEIVRKYEHKEEVSTPQTLTAAHSVQQRWPSRQAPLFGCRWLHLDRPFAAAANAGRSKRPPDASAHIEAGRGNSVPCVKGDPGPAGSDFVMRH